MNKKIITISREFGSGGRTVGKLLAKKLGIQCYDEELIEQLSEKSGFTKEYISEKSEYASHGGWLANAFADRSVDGYSNQDYLWFIQRKIILELAEQGPCIIVGRCADYILKDEDCLKVFIHASLENRAKRIVEQYGERDESPMKRLKDKDKRRAAYYQFYTDMDWADVHNYHVSLDSGVLGIEKCVELIAELYNS